MTKLFMLSCGELREMYTSSGAEKSKKISHVNCPKISPMKRKFRMIAAVIYIFYAAN